mmetsp:Transcript_18562/g.44466  ORF Transcript_18562/g.44466 Transcript_18562/m.44466 type:complete len:110 (+) Transcript_18562:79-408(+)
MLVLVYTLVYHGPYICTIWNRLTICFIQLQSQSATLIAQVFDKADCGREKLEQERLQRAAWGDQKSRHEDEKFAKQHLASQWGKEPLIPFHIVQWDPMHGRSSAVELPA